MQFLQEYRNCISYRNSCYYIYYIYRNSCKRRNSCNLKKKIEYRRENRMKIEYSNSCILERKIEYPAATAPLYYPALCEKKFHQTLWIFIKMEFLPAPKRDGYRGARFFESGKRLCLDKEERECILEKTISPCLQMMRVTAKRLRDQARCSNGFHSRCVEFDTFSIRYSLTW